MTSSEPTDLARLADRYVDDYAASMPTVATYMGVRGHDDRWPDWSPEGREAHADLLRSTLSALASVTPVDRREQVALDGMVERTAAELARTDAGYALADLNTIDSPLQEVRSTFDLMPVATEEDWATIARRLAAAPEALARWTMGLDAAAAAGQASSARQVRLCAGIARRWAGAAGRPGYFAELVAGAPVPADGPLGRDLHRAADEVAASLLQLADHLERDLLPHAPEADGVGRERYAVEARWFTGVDLDLDEAYAWGAEELARIVAEKEAVAERITPGQGVAAAMAALDADPDRMVRGREALQAWLQDTADAAIHALSGVHFDIPDPVRRIEGRLTPTSGEGVYYSGPTEDFSRAGRMWWSLPEGVTDMTTWRETTTVFHEGVPGHHLQIAQTVYNAELLNRWQRLLCHCSAHAEGWALYAERLMAELGFLEDPGDRLGWLDSAELRAARVVLDIGVHLDLPVPAGAGIGDRWTYEGAAEFLRQHSAMDDAMRTDELHRYLGWPGQAPVYKLGERVFLAGREAARARHGADFDLKAWHRSVLDMGPLGLGPLAQELARL